MPFNKIFDYSTKHGVVKHLYGFIFALGGIVIFKGADFERINGYPNYWGWGMEDNVLQQRCLKMGLRIDRSSFYPIGDQNILQLFEGMKRVITKDSKINAIKDNGVDGVNTIFSLAYKISDESLNPNDNIYIVINPNIFVINILSFECITRPSDHQFKEYDLRDKQDKLPPQIGMNVNIFNVQQTQSKSNTSNQTNKQFKIGMGGLL